MIYTLQDGQSFDAELLRQELVKAIGADGWYINTAGINVEFIVDYEKHTFIPSWWKLGETDLIVEQTILAHFANGPTREANKVILQQIAEREAQVTDRRIREAVLGTDNGWLKALNEQIATLRKGLD